MHCLCNSTRHLIDPSHRSNCCNHTTISQITAKCPKRSCQPHNHTMQTKIQVSSDRVIFPQVWRLGGNNLDQSTANPTTGDDSRGTQHPQPGDQHEHPAGALGRPQRVAGSACQKFLCHWEAAAPGNWKESQLANSNSILPICGCCNFEKIRFT